MNRWLLGAGWRGRGIEGNRNLRPLAATPSLLAGRQEGSMKGTGSGAYHLDLSAGYATYQLCDHE